MVRHRDSDEAAEAVAEQLGGFEVEQDDTVPSGHLQVMLGADAPSKIPGSARARRGRPLRRPSRRSRRRAYRASTNACPVDRRRSGARRRSTGGTTDRLSRRGPVTLTAALLDPLPDRVRGRPPADHLLRRRHRRAGRAVRHDHGELGREGREPAARRVRRRAGHAGGRAAARALAGGRRAAGGVVVRGGGGRRARGCGVGAVRRRPGRSRPGGGARGRGGGALARRVRQGHLRVAGRGRRLRARGAAAR